MQSLIKTSIARMTADQCARELLDSVPHVMRFIRQHMRARRSARLTVPQFRALVFLNTSDEPSLSALAEQLGLSPPAASRMVDGLVRRGLMLRRAGSRDRRRVCLSLTARGRSAYQAARAAAQAALGRRFDAISPHDRSLVSESMAILSRLFAPAGE